MVLAERNPAGGSSGHQYNGSSSRSNASVGGIGGRHTIRSMSPANGHASEDSNISEESDHGMRVGHDYQAIVPHIDTLLTKPAPEFDADKAVLVWSPCNEIPENQLEDYISIAKEKYHYNTEQALGMLCWHKFDLEKAMSDLPNFTPFPDEWSVEDKVLFEQAFQFHDKNFHKIKQMLPDKSIACLVKYYYSWKKTRSRTSLMDRQARRLNIQKDGDSDAGSDPASDNDSESGNKDDANRANGTSGNGGCMVLPNSNQEQGKTRCDNCFTTSSGQFHFTSKGVLCRACYCYWRRTGIMRNISANRKHEGGRHLNINKNKRKPPRGIYLNYDDLMRVAQGPPGQGDGILDALDSEVVNLKRAVQNNKQIISQLKHKTSTGIADFRPPEIAPRINSRWTNDEMLIAVQSFRRYGKNFKTIAEIIGNKTEVHLKTFFVNHHKRFKLADVIKEFESDNYAENDAENENGDAEDIDEHKSKGDECRSEPVTKS